MKKNIFKTLSLGVLLLATSACNNGEILVDTEFGDFDYVDSSKGPVIKFAPFANKITKAVPTPTDLEFYHNDFKVYGTKTNNDSTKIQHVFEGVTVSAVIDADSSVENSWTYDIDRYWDKQADSYQFVAFAPAHAPMAYTHNNVEVNDASAKFFSPGNYSLIGQNLQEGAPQENEKNAGFTGIGSTDCDIMRSDAVCVSDPATTPVVSFNFGHTLAKLLVSVKANNAAPYTISVDSICVADLYSTGNYDHNEGWVVKDSSNLVNYYYTAPDTTVDADKKMYFVESLVMPQNISSTQMLTLIYTVYSGSYSEEFTYKASLADLFAGKATEFGKGKSYSVHFTIAPEKNIISFDAGVTIWDNTDSNISIE